MSEYIKNDHQRILTIIGRGGGGKTALACCLLKSLEQGILPEGFGEIKVRGIVYLSEIGSHKVSFANIYSSLLQLLPSEISERLEILYRQPKISVGEKMRQMLDIFQEDKIIVLLDNFELFVNTESENLIDGDLKEALETILRAPHHSLKFIITTRTPARDLALIEPSRHNNLHLEEGLKSPFAENVLRAMDEDGRVGFKNASNEQLGRARELTLGYPRALESLYAIVSVDRYTSIEELLAVELPDTVVENLVGEAFSRLDSTAQKVMQALATYNRPVPPAAIDYLLQQHVPGINSSPILARLVSMHFARREAGRFYLHPVDREYAFNRIPEGVIGKRIGKGARSRIWDQYSLTLRAADYFIESRKPENEWKKLDDLNAQLSEFELRVIAEDYDNAATILFDFFEYLRAWGHYQLVLDLALSIEVELKNIIFRIQALTIIGIAYLNSGKTEIAHKYYIQGLNLAQQFDHRRLESALLTNLSNVHNELGDIVKSIEYSEKSLKLSREFEDESSEAVNLGNLGVSYSDLGEFEKAITLHKQALEIATRHGNKADISITFENIGDCLLGLDNPSEAINNYEKSIQIATELNFIETQCYARWGLSQAYLMESELEKALSFISEAKTYNAPRILHNIFTLQGIIHLRLNNVAESRKSFEIAVIRSNEIISATPNYYDAIDAKSLALCGIGLIVDKQYLISAKDCFLNSRKITNAAGIVKRVMRLFNELSICDSEGLLAEIRPIAEGKMI